MEPTVIKINDYITENKGVTPTEAEPLYNRIFENLNSNKVVVLDFSNVDILTTAFLNVAIGQLYQSFNSETLNQNIKFLHLEEDAIISRIKKVADNAKLFYKNEEVFNNNIKAILSDGD